MSRFELARALPKTADLNRMLDLYDVTGSRRAGLLALAAEAVKKGWWEAYSDVLPDELLSLIGMEAEARTSHIWHLEVIPGLLQTKEYAREANKGYQSIARVPPTQMERRLEARMRRQQVLSRDPPLELSVVLDESALRRKMASNAVMNAQLERLVEVAAYPHVTLHVKPLAAIYPIVTASFVLLGFGMAHETTMPDVVYAERLSSNLYFEDETETFHYRVAFDQLLESALDPADSLELISQVAREAWA
jgi:hypothetical protein